MADEKKPRILAIGNLFPLPWEPHRGSFNRQQFERLEQYYTVEYVVPVAFIEWFKKRGQIKTNTDKTRHYIPYLFTPKFARGFYSYWMYFSLLFFAMGIIKRFKPDLLFVSWAFPDGVAVSKLAKKLGLPFILKVHGTDINDFIDTPSRSKQIVNACQQASSILSVSQALKDKMVNYGVDENKIIVNYNGVDKNIFYPEENLPEKKIKRLLFVGNLKKTKGILACAEAFADIAKQGINVELVYIGQGADKGQIDRILAQHPEIKERVTFLPPMPQNEIRGWMNKSDLLLLPSFNEGVPNVVLEAKSSGLPAIATSVGGIPEILDDSDGILVPLHDHHALVNAIKIGLDTPWNRNAVAQNAERFSWETNIYNVNNAIAHALAK